MKRKKPLKSAKQRFECCLCHLRCNISGSQVLLFLKRGKLFALWGFPVGSEVKASASNAGDLGLTPGSERSPGVGNGNPLQYSCLEDFMDRGAWWATGHGVTESRTQLSTSLIVRRLPSHNLLHCFLSLLSFSIFNVITALQVSILM